MNGIRCGVLMSIAKRLSHYLYLLSYECNLSDIVGFSEQVHSSPRSPVILAGSCVLGSGRQRVEVKLLERPMAVSFMTVVSGFSLYPESPFSNVIEEEW